MTIQALAMFLASLGFLYFVFRNINKNKILFEYAFMWIVIGFGLIIFSLFDIVPSWLAYIFGFGLTSNFLLSIFIFVLLIICFLHSIALSQQKEQIKTLVQEVSITRKRVKELEDQYEK